MNRSFAGKLAPEPRSLYGSAPHAWCNRSNSPLRLVVTNVPGGIEEALRLSANGVDIGAVAEQFAVRVVGPMISG
jgi:hypothetical protein